MKKAKITNIQGCGKLYRFSVRYDEDKWSMCEHFKSIEEAKKFCE